MCQIGEHFEDMKSGMKGLIVNIRNTNNNNRTAS